MARSPILLCGRRCIRATRHFVAAGTIHAIGAGLVIAEIQQRSDATFRLFDYGRDVSFISKTQSRWRMPDRPIFESRRHSLTDTRTLLVSNSHFVFERIDLAPNSAWCLEAERETWLLVLSGSAHAGSFDVDDGRCHFRAVGPRRHSCAGGGLGLCGGLTTRTRAVDEAPCSLLESASIMETTQ